MFKHVSFFALLLLAAGCARDDSSSAATGPDGSPVPAARSVNAGRLASPAGVWAQPTVGAGHAFASLPDRGNLVGYPARPVVRRDGAYTWHRAELSEQHAIRAIATGIMRIKAPSGQELEFRYDRHEEYPNGDWSWVGHLIDGSQADDVVITFGAKAAFGTIAQPAGKAPLRLTIQNGVSWLIETDRAAIAAVRNAATDPKRPDYLVPPKAAAPVQARAGGSAGVTASAAPAMAAATAVGNPLVDLVVGYTPGFASGLGGDSQAQTRLNNMVAITNEAYVNSQVPGRVRLVKTVLVNYPDATLNDTALEELTGFKAPSTRTTPAAAFSALRAARDQYGADLVSLVRKFNDPENDGCGIAWLNGGNSTGRGSIDGSDEFFGYSVVSDGRDTGTDGKTYFCREETLAHELGHNMGSQHDRATATENGKVSYGLYSYSFGYKSAAAAGNFYTIMAYGDRGQTPYRTFSNPRTTFCGGNPCGVENQADVARSLTQAMPLVAAFRASVVPSLPVVKSPIVDDMNADGKSDVFWRHIESGSAATWLMDGRAAKAVVNFDAKAPAAYRPVGRGDTDADGRVDILWTSAAHDLWLWTSTGAAFATTYVASYPAEWQPLGLGDVNGDGKADVLWRHPQTGSFAYWLMDGRTATQVVNVVPKAPAEYWLAAARDMNGDGRVDLVWTSAARDVWVWIANGISFEVSFAGSYPEGWNLLGAGDIDGDRSAELLWRHEPSGSFAYWVMTRASIARVVNLDAKAPAGYRLVSIGDFNGDGKADLLWTSPALDLRLWTSDGAAYTDSLVDYYPSSWVPF